MGTTQRVATWLELAAAPAMRGRDYKVRVHPVGSNGGRCFAISMDDRWLFDGGGRLTVFKGLGSALHFLKLLQVDDFEPGESCSDSLTGGDGRYCLCTNVKRGLFPCPTRPEACLRCH